MKVIIIEDETPAANRLERMLKDLKPGIEILKRMDSVEDSVECFKQNPEVDLIFMDIQLADGLSFDIFKSTNVPAPVIFTTAYDKYALKAFKFNSIDYLLKPIDKVELKSAFEKYEKNVQKGSALNIEDIKNILTNKYKNRFMVKSGSSLLSLKLADVAFFIAEDGVVILTSSKGKRYPVDYTLDQLELVVDPNLFFRINRKILLSIDAVEKAEAHLNGRYKILNTLLASDDSFVSRERVADFKAWLAK